MPWGAIGTADMPHAYNKKEWNNTYDLQEYDSKARQYYPALMRTTTQDPLAEQYYDTSPYAWCANNPVSVVDPIGKTISTNKMTKEDEEKYNSSISWQRENELFNIVYLELEASENTYEVYFGETISIDGQQVKGMFVPNKEGGGKIVFLSSSSFAGPTASEEFFHAFQYENYRLYGNREFNFEFEAKIFTIFVGITLSGYGVFDDDNPIYNLINFIREDKYNTNMNHYDNITINDEFLKDYNTIANEYGIYNDKRRIGTKSYRKRTTTQPASLLKILIRK